MLLACTPNVQEVRFGSTNIYVGFQKRKDAVIQNALCELLWIKSLTSLTLNYMEVLSERVISIVSCDAFSRLTVLAFSTWRVLLR